MQAPSLVTSEDTHAVASRWSGWKTWLIRLAVFTGVILTWRVVWMALPIIWSVLASPQEQALMVSFYENAELAEPGSGDRAVWDHMQSGRDPWQRLLADVVVNPLTAIVSGIGLLVTLRARQVL